MGRVSGRELCIFTPLSLFHLVIVVCIFRHLVDFAVVLSDLISVAPLQ